MRTRLVILSTTLCCLFYNSFGQAQPDEQQKSAFNEFNRKCNNSVKIYWNKTNASPEIISFSYPISYDKDQGKSAEKFLKEIIGLLRYRSRRDTLVRIKHVQREGIRYYTYLQAYENIPVKGGEYVVTVLPDGGIQIALGSFYRDISIVTQPKLSVDDAVQVALDNPPRGRKLKDSLERAELIIYPQNGMFYLSYEVHVHSHHEAETWKYIISASNGDILLMESDDIYSSVEILDPPPPSQANVYLTHPFRDASYTTVSPVPHLNETGYLQGTYAYIYNDAGDEAYNASDDFRYEPNNTHFDEANLYYHIDRYRSYL